MGFFDSVSKLLFIAAHLSVTEQPECTSVDRLVDELRNIVLANLKTINQSNVGNKLDNPTKKVIPHTLFKL